MSVTIHGSVVPGYESVAAAFEKSFEGRPGMGAALAIRVKGEYVARLWAGEADPRSHRAWQEDTPSVIFSCTKGLMSLAVAQLVEQGLVDYDAPVARYWPEFARGGKGAITVREALSHRAGLLATRIDLSLDEVLDWERMVEVLGAQEPVFTPDSGYAYHPITHGWLSGEIIRRVTGLSPGKYLAERIAGPVGAAVWLGMPPEVEPKLAHLTLIMPEATSVPNIPVPEPNWPGRAATFGTALPPTLITETGGFNDPRVLRAELAGAGGIATADGLATIWSAVVTETEGVRLVGPEVIARATREVSGGTSVYPDIGPYYRWGMGFMLDADARRLLSPTSFGHDGAGGQVAFADPTHGVGFAYITNRMEMPPDPRGNSVVTALRDILTR